MQGGAVAEGAREVSSLWWLWLVFGFFWLAISVVILQFDQASVTTVGVLIGAMFIAAALQTMVLFSLSDGAIKWVFAIFAVLFTASGIASFISPENTFAGIADMLGFLFLLVGIFWIIQAFAVSEVNPLWWVGLISGILMVIIAFWTGGQFFIDKQYILLIFAGIWALMQGITDIIRAFQIRKVGQLV
jgi:uncharacterized membrane protein HdeD (DUF308 family)